MPRIFIILGAIFALLLGGIVYNGLTRTPQERCDNAHDDCMRMSMNNDTPMESYRMCMAYHHCAVRPIP